MGNAEVETCLVDVARTLVFPVSLDGHQTTVNFPFRFGAAEPTEP